MEHTHNTGTAGQTAEDLHSFDLIQLLGNAGRGIMFFIGKLGMHVQVTAEGDDLIGDLRSQRLDLFSQHKIFLLLGFI